MKNGDKIILDLCGGTGAWSKPYKEAGYIVHNITLPDFDVINTYPFNGLATNSLEGHKGAGCRFLSLHFSGERRMLNIKDIRRIHGILAAPPCTEFSLAKNSRPRDFNAGMQIVRACLEIIWHCQSNGNLKWWALENPRCFLRQFIGRPAFTFEQWEFGDEGIKPTDLWGFFNDPRKTVRVRPQGMSRKYPNGRWNANGWSKSAEKRAITPKGFAEAFFKANP
jgi:hypothetical protein